MNLEITSYIQLKDLFTSNFHLGKSYNIWGPDFDNNIYGTRKGLNIIDLDQTLVQLTDAFIHIKRACYLNRSILIVTDNKTAEEELCGPRTTNIATTSSETCLEKYLDYSESRSNSPATLGANPH